MGRRSESARPLQLLPIVTVALLAALGWTGLRTRRAADAQAALRPHAARPSPARFLRPEPALRFEPETLDLGRLEPDSRREAHVSWRLRGAAPRRVLGVDATCGCVLVDDLRGELAPGDAGSLRLVVRPPRRPGPFHATVKVWLQPPSESESQGPGAGPPRLVVRGHVLSRVGVRPERLILGARTVGARVERLVEVDVVPALAGSRVRAALEGFDGSIAVEPSVFADRPGATLRIGMRVPSTPGPIAGRVVVRVDGETGLLEGAPRAVEVPVSGEAVVRR